jgi:prolipoprotein diacylglyceryltransferase
MEKMKDICYFGVVVGVLVLAIIILKIYTGIDFWSLGYLLAPWVTVTGIVLGLYGAFIALKTYRSNNSLRKWELINPDNA